MAKFKAHIRYRTKDNRIVPGITTILGLLNKPALLQWANNLGLKNIELRAYVDDKADIGTLAHAMITDKLEGKVTNTSDYSKNQIDLAENSVLSFWSWEKEHHIEEVVFCERPMVSEMYRFGGTLDIYAKINGKHEIIDLKTGKGIYSEASWQCSALKNLLEENGFPVDGLRIVNIPRSKDESFMEKIITKSEWETGFEIFKHLLAIYYLEKK
jgi:hypothetical protein